MSNSNHENIVRDNWLKRYNCLDDVTRKEIDELREALDNGEREKYQLKKIKRSYIMPDKGDIFILQPREGLYFYGLVINAHIKNEYGDAMIIIAIFKTKTCEMSVDSFSVDYSKLMLFPIMVSRHYWTSGYFYKVGHTEELGDIPSYGFYDYYRIHHFWDEYGKEITEQPEYLSVGAATIL